jgi:hypothetical protein
MFTVSKNGSSSQIKQTGAAVENGEKWYIDGTFSIVKKPFMQIWTIHAFFRYKNEKKMVLLICSSGFVHKNAGAGTKFKKTKKNLPRIERKTVQILG